MFATLLGLAVALWVLRSVGLDGFARAAHRIGWSGAVLYLCYSLGVFALLGAAWLTAAAGESWRRLPLFTWARLVREAVADLLPFSQLGGLVVGSRALAGGGVANERVYASMIVDLSTEMASQLIFTLFGLTLMASLLLGENGVPIRSAVFAGTAALAIIALLFLLGQHRMVEYARRLARRLLPSAAVAIERVDAELRRIYTQRRQVSLSFLFNLAGWTGSAAGSWIVLRLIGTPLPFIWVLSIESLIFTVRSVAFAVPGALGFQEAAYALVSPLFGLPAETAVALSLIKRARDFAIAIPVLLLWQWLAARKLFQQR